MQILSSVSKKIIIFKQSVGAVLLKALKRVFIKVAYVGILEKVDIVLHLLVGDLSLIEARFQVLDLNRIILFQLKKFKN